MGVLHAYSRGEKLIVAGGLIVGLLFALLAMGLWSREDNMWRRVTSPANETPAKILAVDRSLHVYVRTTQGNLYLCGGDLLSHSCEQVSAADLPVNPVPVQWRSCGSSLPNIPQPPGKIIDSITVGRCVEAKTYSELAILDDGGIWQWYRVLSWANWFAFGVCLLLGLAVGAAGGILLIEVRRRLV